MSRVQSTATVLVTVEVTHSGPWGADCTVEQVFSQAGKESVQRVCSLLTESGMRVVGEPKVTAVLAERGE